MKGEAQDKQPILLGAVDLGSNSFRVEIGRVEDYRITTESYWKETVRLAGGIDENGREAFSVDFNAGIDELDKWNVDAVGDHWIAKACRLRCVVLQREFHADACPDERFLLKQIAR